MVRAGQEVIVVEASSSRRRSWALQGRALGVEVRSCATLEQAIDAIRAAPAAAIVATMREPTGAAILVARAARELSPPAEVLFVTDDPERLRASLRALGLVAEVLRRPATIPELVDRLGLSSANPPNRGRSEP